MIYLSPDKASSSYQENWLQSTIQLYLFIDSNDVLEVIVCDDMIWGLFVAVNIHAFLWSMWLEDLARFKSHKLSLDHLKTKMLIFNKSPTQCQAGLNKVKTDSSLIQVVGEFKNLSVLLDNELWWANHIHMISSKLSAVVGMLNKANKFLSRNWLMIMYNVFIFLSYMNYSCIIWGCACCSTWTEQM